MHDPSATLFQLLHQEWEFSQQGADAAWAQIWRRVRKFEVGAGSAPTDQEIAQAVSLGNEACEWLVAVRRQVQLARQRVPII